MNPHLHWLLSHSFRSCGEGLPGQHLRGSNFASSIWPSLSSGSPAGWWSGPEGACLCLAGTVLYASTPQMWGGGGGELVAGLPFLGMVNKPLGDINCHQALGI